jgi:hypothetical protein
VRDRAEAAPTSIAAGQHVERDFVLEAVPLYKVSGRILGAPPNIGPVLQVFNTDGDDASPLSNFYNPSTGDFRLSLPRGVFTIKAFTQIFPNGQEQRLEARAAVNVAGDLENIILALQPAASVPIEIRLEPTKADSPFYTANSRPYAYVRLFPEDPLGSEQSSQSESPQNPSPVLRNLESGKYWVEVDNVYQGYVQSLRCGSQDLTRETLTVAAGQRLPPIDLVLRDDAATLDVSIRSDAPIKERPAVFALSGAGNPQIALRMAMSWMSGTNGISAELNDLAPGDYTIYAFDNLPTSNIATRMS